jgi:hypothetical protein
MQALTLNASVHMEPVKPASLEVKVPIAAIVRFLFFVFRAAPIAASYEEPLVKLRFEP